MPKLISYGDDPIMADFGRKGKRIVIEMCRTELESLLYELNKGDFTPWSEGRTGDTWVQIRAINNTGVE